MSRTFSLAKTFRMTSNPLLKDFFAACGVGDMGLIWDELGQRDPAPLVAAVEGLGPPRSVEIEGILRDLYDLSDRFARTAIEEAALTCARPEVVTLIPEEYGPYDAALWTWLNHRDLVVPALRMHRVLTAPWWRRRDDLPPRSAVTAPAPALAGDIGMALAERITHVLKVNHGLIGRCTVETLTRGDTTYYFAYADDHVQTHLEHDAAGQLLALHRRPAFEIVFAYVPDRGVLELCAKLAPRTKKKLEEVFVEVVVHAHLGPYAPPSYDLSALLDEGFDLATDPADGVKITVKAVRVHLPNQDVRIVLEEDVGAGPGRVREQLAHYLREESFPLEHAAVGFATFAFEFETEPGRRAGSMTIDVAAPNACSLRSQREDRVALAHKYFRRWGILRERALPHAA
jgi:hypothetical protein